MPHEEHPALDCPDDSQTIWRYMGFSKLMWLLHQGKLHFHRADDFDDPFEAMTPKAFRQFRNEKLLEFEGDSTRDNSEVLEKWEDGFKSMRKSMFLNCWHGNDTESAAMWDLYGNVDKSVAIVSTIGQMKEAFDDIERSVYLSRVTYADFYSDLNNLDPESETKDIINRTRTLNALHQVLFKREEFAHEKEIRALIRDTSPLSDGESPLYINLSVDVDKLVESVYVAPDAPSWFSKVVKTAVAQSDTGLTSDQVHPSQLDKDPWY